MKIIAYIGARGGSKGLPGKNIKPLAGKPLIAWTIEAALGAKLVNRVVVSSDDPKILKVAEQYGAETIQRPKWMASGHVNLEPGIRHMLRTLKKKENYQPDIIAVLQPTSPLRTVRDIDNSLKLMVKQNVKAVLSVYEENNGFLKTFILNKDGFMNPTVSAEHPFMSRWLLPKIYMFNGAIHLIDRKNFMRDSYLPKDKILPYVMTKEQSEDIDTIISFRKTEAILKQKVNKQNMSNRVKFGLFLTVRTSSSRLPGKTLLKFRGKRSIEHVINRVKKIKGVDEIIMCTTTDSSDDILEQIAKKNKIKVFRGSLEDKVSRWLGAADKFSLNYFVTIDAADDVFCDPELIDLAVRQMKEKPVDYLKIPDDLVCGGLAPVISVTALRRVVAIKDTDNVENYAPYFLNTGLFKIREIKVKDKIFHNRNVRLTLDYKEDYEFFKRIFDELRMDSNTIPLRRILILLNKKPELNQINFHRHQDYLNDQKRITTLVLKKNYKNIKI